MRVFAMYFVPVHCLLSQLSFFEELAFLNGTDKLLEVSC